MDEEVKALKEKLNGFEAKVEQQFKALGEHFNEQSASRTQDMLAKWAEDKPHFQAVRTIMGHLLTPDKDTGIAVIPLKDGRVDLDATYEVARFIQFVTQKPVKSNAEPTLSKSDYAAIDQALAPYADTIKQFGKTPGQAVSQLFAWFDSLAKNPDEAFPALIDSFKYNPEKMLAKYGYYRKPPEKA